MSIKREVQAQSERGITDETIVKIMLWCICALFLELLVVGTRIRNMRVRLSPRLRLSTFRWRWDSSIEM